MKQLINFKLFFILLLSFGIGFITPSSAIAAEKDKSARRAALMMQKMQQDMQAKMDAEKANMQTLIDTQKKEFEEKLISKEAELAKQNKKLITAERKNKNLEADIQKMTAEKMALDTKLQQTQLTLETTQKNLADLNALHTQALADLKFNDNQRKTLSTNLAQTSKSRDECEVKNEKLHQFGTELIKIYDKPASYDAAMRKEQFFQLKRVELENILQTKQDNLDDARFINNKKAAY